MNVLQVVTYISRDGIYGGPTSVALAQQAELRRLGHNVTLIAAAPPAEAQENLKPNPDGVNLFSARRLLGLKGFAYIYSPALLIWLMKNIGHYDVIHIHFARDLIAGPASLIARLHKKHFFLQTHGMVDASEKKLAAVFDGLFTKPALAKASTTFALTDNEQQDLVRLCPGSSITRVKNGLPLRANFSKGSSGLVLFLARLQARKRPVAFVQMAKLLCSEFPNLRFIIAGPDEGELASTVDEIQINSLEGRVSVIGAVTRSRAAELMDEADVYVLPSFGEIFPMTAIEAFQSQTPTVVTESLGIAGDCSRYQAAIVTDGSPEALAQAVSDILTQPQVREKLVDGGKKYISEELDIRKVMQPMMLAYEHAAHLGQRNDL